MQGIQHGITRLVPGVPVRARLTFRPGLLLLLDDGGDDDEEDDAQNNDLQALVDGHEQREGSFPPRRGDADNEDLQQPTREGRNEEKRGDLLRQNGDEDDAEINLQPPTIEGKEDKLAADIEEDLLRHCEGPIKDGNFLPRTGPNYEGDFFPLSIDESCLHAGEIWKLSFLKCLRAAIQKLAYDTFGYADVIITHAMPRVDPKVKKKKTSLLLCVTIKAVFHPGEQRVQSSYVRDCECCCGTLAW